MCLLNSAPCLCLSPLHLLCTYCIRDPGCLPGLRNAALANTHFVSAKTQGRLQRRRAGYCPLFSLPVCPHITAHPVHPGLLSELQLCPALRDRGWGGGPLGPLPRAAVSLAPTQGRQSGISRSSFRQLGADGCLGCGRALGASTGAKKDLHSTPGCFPGRKATAPEPP